MVGNATTVSLIVRAGPVQPLAVGVIVYCSIPPEALFKSCIIAVPQEVEHPEAPVTVPDKVVADHVNVVPATVEVKTLSVEVPVQRLCPLPDATGAGLTMIVSLIEAPGQDPGAGPVGVMVNITVTVEFVVFVKM